MWRTRHMASADDSHAICQLTELSVLRCATYVSLPQHVRHVTSAVKYWSQTHCNLLHTAWVMCYMCLATARSTCHISCEMLISTHSDLLHKAWAMCRACITTAFGMHLLSHDLRWNVLHHSCSIWVRLCLHTILRVSVFQHVSGAFISRRSWR